MTVVGSAAAQRNLCFSAVAISSHRFKRSSQHPKGTPSGNRQLRTLQWPSTVLKGGAAAVAAMVTTK